MFIFFQITFFFFMVFILVNYTNPDTTSLIHFFMLNYHFMPRKDATCIQTHSRRLPQICREQANTVLCFTFICFSFPIRTYQNNTVTLGNAQLCRTQNPGSRAQWTLPGCRMGNTALLEEDTATVYFRTTKHSKWHKTWHCETVCETKVWCWSGPLQGLCKHADSQECSSCSGSLMWGDRATLWRCGQMTVPWEEICHRQPMRCCRFRVTVQSVI